jgi:hypothetical protein
MSLDEIRAAANRLRSLQQQASIAVDRRDEEWQRALVSLRRDIASGIAELSAATRKLSPQEEASRELAALDRSISALRHALAMHQASWPAILVDPRQPDFKASVARVRGAYDDLFTCLDLLERKRATSPQSGCRSSRLTLTSSPA